MTGFEAIRGARRVLLAAALIAGGVLAGNSAPAQAQANPYCYYPYYNP
jgi:hypothetical protein